MFTMPATRHERREDADHSLQDVAESFDAAALMTMAFVTPTLLTTRSDLVGQGRSTWNQAARNYESGFRAGQQDARRNWGNNYLFKQDTRTDTKTGTRQDIQTKVMVHMDTVTMAGAMAAV
jgi:hypothetical protein